MKNLEKAIMDYEKAKERMNHSKARYEADVKRFRASEAAKTEAENLAIVMAFRELNVPVSDLKNITTRIKAGMPEPAEELKEDAEQHDESHRTQEESSEEENRIEKDMVLD